MKYLLAFAVVALATFATPAFAGKHCWTQCDANGSGHCETNCD